MASGKAAATATTEALPPSRTTEENTHDSNDSETTTPVADDESDDDDFDDPDPQNPDVSSYNNGDHVFHSRFEPLNNLAQKTFATTGPTFLSREEHNACYRATWSQLRHSVAVDTKIPDSIFDPPRSYVQVRVSHWPISENEGHYCCPCDLPDDELPSLDVFEVVPTSTAGVGSSTAEVADKVVEKRAVLTKDLFLKVVGEAFYGEKYTIGTEEDRPVIDRFDYMMSGGSLIGHIYAMVRGFKKPIW